MEEIEHHPLRHMIQRCVRGRTDETHAEPALFAGCSAPLPASDCRFTVSHGPLGDVARPVRRMPLADERHRSDLGPMPATLGRYRNARSLLRYAAAVLVAWTAFALLSLTHFFLGKSVAGGEASLSDLASHILLFYWGWALVTPVVLWSARDLASRVRLDTQDAAIGWLRAAAIAPAVIFAHAVWYISAVRIAGVEPDVQLNWPQVRDYALRHGGGDLATYAAIVGAVLLIDARRRARERELAAAALESKLARADAELLRWQLQPHFLFNTLNTVSTLVLKGETQSADHAIGLIARWLRDALSQRADAIVTLGEEIASVQRYVAIEKLRFDESLRLDVQVDDDALVARIPSLLVQPLVENAIRHGFAAGDAPMPITISARMTDQTLRVCVRNRDVAAQSTFGDARAPLVLGSDGFGLRYVRERLAHFYGESATLAVMSDGLDVVATLELPARAAVLVTAA